METLKTQSSTLAAATACFLNRQSRTEHPLGTFDNAKRWYPSEAESYGCCNLRNPTRNWPNSLNTHCRTLEHVATLHNIDKKSLKIAVRAINDSGIEHTAAAIASLLNANAALAAIETNASERSAKSI